MWEHRPFPEEEYGSLSAEHPLMLRRWDTSGAECLPGADELPLLEQLLRCSWGEAHLHIASVLWDW